VPDLIAMARDAGMMLIHVVVEFRHCIRGVVYSALEVGEGRQQVAR
jgi:hypothetical protein